MFFENYSMRMLSIRGTDFIAHWAYEERISTHAQPAVKCEQFLHVQCWAYAERILSHTEHSRNEFQRMLSIRGTDFIACWACLEMFKTGVSWPNQIRFSKILFYRPLGPYGFGFCKKSIKKFHACVPLRFCKKKLWLSHYVVLTQNKDFSQAWAKQIFLNHIWPLYIC